MENVAEEHSDLPNESCVRFISGKNVLSCTSAAIDINLNSWNEQNKHPWNWL